LWKKNLAKNPQTVKDANFFHSHGGATYMHKQCIRGTAIGVDSPRAISNSLKRCDDSHLTCLYSVFGFFILAKHVSHFRNFKTIFMLLIISDKNCIVLGKRKEALNILMHIGCPSVDERDQQGFYDMICDCQKQTLFQF